MQTYEADPAPEDIADLLRLTELEVHHLDLDCGYQIADWLTSSVRTCLPLPDLLARRPPQPPSRH